MNLAESESVLSILDKLCEAVRGIYIEYNKRAMVFTDTQVVAEVRTLARRAELRCLSTTEEAIYNRITNVFGSGVWKLMTGVTSAMWGNDKPTRRTRQCRV